jgi:hypothetical protein
LFPTVAPDGSVAAYLFSALILMGVVTTLMAPMLLRRTFDKDRAEQ